MTPASPQWPHLAQPEWHRVRQAMLAMGEADCRTRPGFLSRVLGRKAHAHERDAAAPLDVFICRSRRGRPSPQAVVDALLADGFSKDQLAAIALLAL
ncbi:hypothetical protein NSDW_15380 [Novosphingobium olei]|nr:hypothetical protein NSDW_15380 [Novosphingobium olei]